MFYNCILIYVLGEEKVFFMFGLFIGIGEIWEECL